MKLIYVAVFALLFVPFCHADTISINASATTCFTCFSDTPNPLYPALDIELQMTAQLVQGTFDVVGTEMQMAAYDVLSVSGTINGDAIAWSGRGWIWDNPQFDPYGIGLSADGASYNLQDDIIYDPVTGFYTGGLYIPLDWIATATPIDSPEPASLTLLGAGLIGLGLLRCNVRHARVHGSHSRLRSTRSN